MADATDSKSVVRKGVWVRVPPRAPKNDQRIWHMAGAGWRCGALVVMAGPEICGACQQPRSRAHDDRSGKVFICIQCEADAEQLIRIQDTIWAEAQQPPDAPPHSDGRAM
jgi:hypothetical protein